MNLNQRDWAWLLISLALSSASSAALVSAVIEPSRRTILDLDWPAILGCTGAAMFGGIISTLFVLHRAGETGRKVDVPLQMALDLGRAVILALLVWGAFAVQKWEPDPLPGILAVAGLLGEKLLNLISKIFLKAVAIFGGRLPGPPTS